ncbi:hypothetical protein [Bradyrhizobium iriomotense]|uniref:hypothetical protein n=1 Tax=Bradyrhizobium iriomotense TaxID=441950 RepID=UPI0024E15649|nr:hypothetical protein [Bradyrhizobium iriomotense]
MPRIARRIREYPLQTEVLIFTVHNSSLLEQEAFQAGARLPAEVRRQQACSRRWRRFWRTSHHVEPNQLIVSGRQPMSSRQSQLRSRRVSTS